MTRVSRTIIGIRIVLLSLISATMFCAIARAQEQKPPALPLPEMQRLAKFYVGTWNYTENYPKSAMFPNGGVNTGVYISELGPGGNSIINHFHSQGPVGDFQGVMVMTWDPQEKAYKAFALGNFPGAIVETGQFEGDALTFRAELTIGAMKLSLRNVAKPAPDGKLIIEEYSSANGAPEKMMVRVEAVRK